MQGAKSRLGLGEPMRFVMRNSISIVAMLLAGCDRHSDAQSGTASAPSVEVAITPTTGVVEHSVAKTTGPTSHLSQPVPSSTELTQSRTLLQQQLALPPDEAEAGVIRILRRKLAALGDEQELNRITQKLTSTNLADQSQALEDARVVGGKAIIISLVAVLNDKHPGGRILSDMGVPPPRQAAAEILAELITNTPLHRKEARFQNDEEIERFKLWWKTIGSEQFK